LIRRRKHGITKGMEETKRIELGKKVREEAMKRHKGGRGNDMEPYRRKRIIGKKNNIVQVNKDHKQKGKIKTHLRMWLKSSARGSRTGGIIKRFRKGGVPWGRNPWEKKQLLVMEAART